MALSIDRGEFARFVAAGLIATAANLAAVMGARSFVSYGIALLCGIAAGTSVSFLLSKLWAFRSRKWDRSPIEAGRFLLVYGSGVILYWLTAVVVEMLMRRMDLAPGFSEMGGVLVGAGIMTFTSYFGHRYFTFQTHARE